MISFHLGCAGVVYKQFSQTYRRETYSEMVSLFQENVYFLNLR